jgi:hypothetical protein
VRPHPVGALGAALGACEPSALSDALAERLGALVDQAPWEALPRADR